jgi:hypothetical protein
VFKNSVEGGNSGLSDSVGFWKIWKNSAETQWRRWRNSRNVEYRNSAGFGDSSADFTDKSTIFPEIRRGNFWANFAKNRANFVKNR